MSFHSVLILREALDSKAAPKSPMIDTEKTIPGSPRNVPALGSGSSTPRRYALGLLIIEWMKSILTRVTVAKSSEYQDLSDEEGKCWNGDE
jgi:hypothetical protein